MAGADRMTIEEVVKQVLLDEHADVIREAVKAVAGEMMEIEVSELVGAELGERRPEDRERGERRDQPVGAGEAVGGPHQLQLGRGLAVGVDDALGRAGGAGGEQHRAVGVHRGSGGRRRRPAAPRGDGEPSAPDG